MIRSRKIFAFAAGVLTTFGVSSAIRRGQQKIALPESPQVISAPREPWSREGFDAALAKLDQAGTKAEQLQLAGELAEIPVREIPAVLEAIPLEKDGRLGLAASTLLIHWASEDGEAALTWAWGRMRESNIWREAARSIFATWAWTDPDSLGKWTLAYMAGTKLEDPTLAEAQASETPLLTFDDVSGIARMLVREDPKLGYEVFLKRGGWASNDDEIYKSLEDPAKIEQALHAFPNLEDLKARHESMTFTMDSLAHAESLMTHWMKIDPEGFAKSGYRQYLHPRFLRTGDVADEWKLAAAPERLAEANRIVDKTKGDLKRGAVMGIADEWVAMDPVACRAWLDSLPSGLTNEAKGGFVSKRAVVDLEGTLDFIAGTDPAYRHTYLMTAFDAWTKDRPGDVPDMTAWSEQERRVWGDLEALKEVVEK